MALRPRGRPHRHPEGERQVQKEGERESSYNNTPIKGRVGGIVNSVAQSSGTYLRFLYIILYSRALWVFCSGYWAALSSTVTDKGLPPPERGIWNEIPYSKKSMDVNGDFLAWCSSPRNKKRHFWVHRFGSTEWGGGALFNELMWRCCRDINHRRLDCMLPLCWSEKYLSFVQLCE